MTPWDCAQGNKMLEGKDVYWQLNDGRFELVDDGETLAIFEKLNEIQQVLESIKGDTAFINAN